MSGSTYYLIVRDENGGSIVSEETSDPAASIVQGGAFRKWFPVVEFHTVCDNGRGPDSYRLVKENGELSLNFFETEDENT